MTQRPTVGLAAGRGVWVVLPTYNERENLPPMADAILANLPEARLLIVDDDSPDGTGEPGKYARCRQLADRGCCPLSAKRVSAPPIGMRFDASWTSRARWPSSRWTPTSATIRGTCRASESR